MDAPRAPPVPHSYTRGTGSKNALIDGAHQDYRTPQALFDHLNAEFHFDFDPCPDNPTFDGLKVPWGRSNFVNPPFAGPVAEAFLDRCCDEGEDGKTVVLLYPIRARRALIRVAEKADQVRLLSPDVRFVRSDGKMQDILEAIGVFCFAPSLRAGPDHTATFCVMHWARPAGKETRPLVFVRGQEP